MNAIYTNHDRFSGRSINVDVCMWQAEQMKMQHIRLPMNVSRCQHGIVTIVILGDSEWAVYMVNIGNQPVVEICNVGVPCYQHWAKQRSVVIEKGNPWFFGKLKY